MKKNNFKSLAAVLSLAMAATAVPVNANAAAAPKITVSKKTVYSGKTATVTVNNLKKGYTVQLSSTEGGVNFKQKKVKATGKKVSTTFTVKAAKNIADNTKTKIKAVVKNASGKKVKTINQAVTLKQLAKSLTVKDLVETTVQVGAEVNADATIAPAAAKGAYKKTFTSSNTDVLQVVNASNGLFKAVAPGTATISVTAVNDKNKVVEGSKTLTVTVQEADDTNKPDDTNTPDDTNKPGDDNTTTTPTGPAITTDYQLTLTPGKTSINADSVDSTDIDVLLKAPTDATINKDMAVAVQLTLGTRGVGSLSQEDITLLWDETKQGWAGVIKFTSATLTTTTVSRLTAAVSSVINPPADKELIGLGSNAIDLTLVPVTPTVADNVAATAVSAVVESLDRITITFNKSVAKENFLLNDDSGKVANGTNTQNVAGNETPLYFEMYIKDAVSETDNVWPSGTISNNRITSVTNGTDITHENVEAVLAVPNNDKALTFVLKNDTTSKFFTDNSKFLITFIDRHVNQTAKGELSNYISDTTIPNVMTVRQNNKKSIIVKFDQPVYSEKDSNISSDEKLKLISALTLSNYAIDGMRLDQTWSRSQYSGGTYFGDAATHPVKIELTDAITRDEVKITLGQETDGKQCYFDAGTHVIQVSNVGDYAARTETGTNNRITTKNFDFTIDANTQAPNFIVTAQSPEQYKITFNTEIAELEKYAIGQEITLSDIALELQFKDTGIDSDNAAYPGEAQKVAMGDFVSVTEKSGVSTSGANNGQRTGLSQGIKCTRIENDADGNHQLKLEVTNDWTKLNNYKANRKNYYNYTLRVMIGKGKDITNAANGVTAKDLSKNITGDIISQVDITEPKITDITEIVAETEYKVTFSEPVQASNDALADSKNDYYAHAYTPAYNPTLDQEVKIGTMTAEFYNKDTKLTYPGRITGWADLEDMSVYVRPETTLPKGGHYTLIMRGVSDDIGNTSNTLTKDFETGTVTSEFKVLSVLADSNYEVDRAVRSLQTVTSNNGPDAIYIEFSKAYMSAPITDSVLNTQNWTINGASLPVGSTIISGLGNDTEIKNKLASSGHTGITIYLPDNTLTDTDATLIKIGSNVKAQDGSAIAGRTTFTTQSIFKNSILEGQSLVNVNESLATNITGNIGASTIENN